MLADAPFTLGRMGAVRTWGAKGSSVATPQRRATPAVPARDGKQPFWTDIPFTAKAAQQADGAGQAGSGDLVLEGYASTWVQDRDGEYVLPTAFDATLPTYLAKNPMLLWQHNFDTPLGQITAAQVDATGLAVTAWVRQPVEGEEPWKFSAYHDIKSGIVRTFSIGGWFTRDMLGGAMVISEVELWEISVVSVPSNPDSIFEAAVKSLSGERRPDLSQKAVSQMGQLLGLHAISDPELHRMGAEARRARYDELVQLYQRAGKHAPRYDAYRTYAARIEASSELDAEAARAVIAITKAVRGDLPVQKAGRVLSSATEAKLRGAHAQLKEAHDSIGEVLALVQRTDPDGTGSDAPSGELDIIEPLVADLDG